MISSTYVQSTREEIANSVSHGIGFLSVVVTGPVLISDAAQKGGAMGVVGAGSTALLVATGAPDDPNPGSGVGAAGEGRKHKKENKDMMFYPATVHNFYA